MRSVSSHCLIAAGLCLSIMCQPGPVVLVSGQSRVVTVEQNRIFLMEMQQDCFARLELRQNGTDAVMGLFAPNGELLFTRDSHQGEVGVEAISFIVRDSGFYRLKITTPMGEVGGEYVLLFQNSKMPDEVDRSHARASLHFEAASQAMERKEWNVAITELQSARHAWSLSSDGLQEAVTHIQEAVCLRRIGETDGMSQQYKKAVDRLKELDEQALLARVLNRLGTIAIRQNRVEES